MNFLQAEEEKKGEFFTAVDSSAQQQQEVCLIHKNISFLSRVKQCHCHTTLVTTSVSTPSSSPSSSSSYFSATLLLPSPPPAWAATSSNFTSVMNMDTERHGNIVPRMQATPTRTQCCTDSDTNETQTLTQCNTFFLKMFNPQYHLLGEGVHCTSVMNLNITSVTHTHTQICTCTHTCPVSPYHPQSSGTGF